jgi:arylsulfatase A-like enzyme
LIQRLLLGLALFLASSSGLTAATAAPRYPSVLVVTIDTLRADRLGAYGYGRETSPYLDRLIEAGVRFDQARCVEPLTAPSMASMLTSLYPHDHGATRNGLGARPGLPSLPRILQERGFRTAAFISNWTLRDKLLGMGDHFDDFFEIFTRKRYFGLMNSEANGDDVTDAAVEWLEDYAGKYKSRPFFAWVHYSDPHNPYILHKEYAERLGIRELRDVPASDRYDTEVAFADDAVGRLLKTAERLFPGQRLLIVFAADHGENLGEHGYWGHGRFLWEENLRIPFSITWPERIAPGNLAPPASLLDVAPTLVGLLGLPTLETFRGFDWSPVLLGQAEPPGRRTTYHQAHRGAVHSPKDTEKVRRRGLLEVGIVEGSGEKLEKEVLRVKSGEKHAHYSLHTDPAEQRNLSRPNADPSEALAQWLETVRQGLQAADDLPPPSLDEESMDKLRALGYLD